MKTRLYFLDNLRTVLIFFVVVYHAAIVYQSGFEANWIVSDPQKIKSIGILGLILDSFIMFIIFFISGYFIPNSIKNKTNWVFVKSKLKRIVLPWFLAILTLIPLYKIIFLYSRGISQDAWYTYFHFFEREGSNLAVFANSPTQSWLWFLPVLFLFQLVYLLLYKLNVFNIKLSLKKAVVFTFVIALLYSKVIASLGLRGWTYSHFLDFQTERLIPYFLVFLLGSLCHKHDIFNTYFRSKKLYIIVNIVLSIALTIYIGVAMNYFFNIVYPDRNYFYISKDVDSIIYYGTGLLVMLSMLYILIDLFALKFNKSNKLMSILNKGSYNVYIIHMVIIGLIATLLLGFNMNSFLKFLILSLSSFIISHLIIHIYYKTKTIMKTKSRIVSILLITLLLGCKNNQSVDISNDSNQVITEDSTIVPKMSIHEAVIRGDINIVKQHIASGTDINIKDPIGESSPLATAITFNKEDITLFLIESRAEINSLSKDGSTPLHVASFFGHVKIVKVLLEKNADKTIKNNAGSTAYEAVIAPFEMVKPIYDKLSLDLMPLGFKINYSTIEKNRDIIAELLE